MKQTESVPAFEGEEIIFIVVMCAGIVVLGTAAVAAWLI